MTTALGRYRTMAYLVGTGLLVLCLVGLPLRYLADKPAVVEIVGPIHGFLYIVYLVAAYDLARRARFTLLQLAAMIAAGLVPFLAFVLERRVVARVRAEEALGKTRAHLVRASRYERRRHRDRWGMSSETIYHLALRANWEEALAGGAYCISSIDRTLEEEGFIHASFADQLQGTADRFYHDHDDVLLLAIDPGRLDVEVRVEGARDEARGFPHLYGPLSTAAVASVTPLRLGDDGRLVIDLA